MSAHRIAASLLLVLSLSGSAMAANAVRDMLAETCRFELLAPTSVVSLSDGSILEGDGWVSRVESQACTYVVHAAVNHYMWTDVSFRFIPAKSGTVEWQLSGRWQWADSNTLFRQVVEWRDAAVEGGSFVTAFKPAVTSWHDNASTGTLSVAAGKPVVLRIKARAVPPAGFTWMRRIESTDTPAHRAMAHFRRGVSLGNNLEAPRGDNWGAWYTPADLRSIAREGFDHVRIPVAWHAYTGPGPSYKINGPIFIYLDRILSMAMTNNLSVIINVQHFSSFMDNPAKETPRFLAIWEQLAARYWNTPSTVAFELLNEPNSNAVTSALNPIYHKAIEVIRRTNPDRTIFLDPGGWSSASELPRLWLPDWDSNVVVSVHCYEPFLFTHQGAPWALPYAATTNIAYPGPPPRPLAVAPACEQMSNVVEWVRMYNELPPAQNPCSITRVRQAVRHARAWSEYYGRPVHFGEFGCYSEIDPASRARYIGDVRKEIERAGLAWAIWDWKAGFRYWNPSTARCMPGLRQALFGP